MLHRHSRESLHIMVERPLCPKCQVRMILLGVKLGLAGPHLRTFECPKCELTYSALAEHHIKSRMKQAVSTAN
jgi:hypothetical protein